MRPFFPNARPFDAIRNFTDLRTFNEIAAHFRLQKLRMVAAMSETSQKRSAPLYSAPTGKEIIIPHNERIISETSLSGQIIYANEAYWHYTGFRPGQVIGAPHTRTWHPSMPRVIFRHMASCLDTETGAFAYVCDITNNGDHYWNFVQVIPTAGPNGKRAGFMMFRRSPDRRALQSIIPLYTKLREIERKFTDKAEGVHQSSIVLDSVLGDLGMTYEEFIFSRAVANDPLVEIAASA